MEEAENRTGILDLGGLGLTSLPAELFELQDLRELNLGAGTPSLGDLRFVPDDGRNQMDGQIDQIARLSLLQQLCVGLPIFKVSKLWRLLSTLPGLIAPVAGSRTWRRCGPWPRSGTSTALIVA